MGSSARLQPHICIWSMQFLLYAWLISCFWRTVAPATTVTQECQELVFLLFKDCIQLLTKTTDSPMNDECCKWATEANDAYCYCDSTSMQAARSLGVEPNTIRDSLVNRCAVPLQRLRILDIRGCSADRNLSSPAPGPEPPPLSSTGNKEVRDAVRWGLLALIPVVLAAAVTVIFCWCRSARRARRAELPSFTRLKAYPYALVAEASANFSHSLGTGASAEVFRASLDGQLVAVKRLKGVKERHTSEKEFRNEAEQLGRLRHVNLVELLGYAVQPNAPKLLIYEYMPGGTLSTLLYGPEVATHHSAGAARRGRAKGNRGAMGGSAAPSLCPDDLPRPEPVSFRQRMDIAIGIARGIDYCHHSVKPPVIHRDIKPSNILIDETGMPKVSDFGLAKLAKGEPQRSPFSDISSVDLTRHSQDLASMPLSEPTSPNHSFSSVMPGWPFGMFEMLSSVYESFKGTRFALSTNGSLPSSAFRFNGKDAYNKEMKRALTFNNTSVVGTIGYIDPMYFNTGTPTTMSDVYSFGVLLIELVTGMPPLALLLGPVAENVKLAARPYPLSAWLQDLVNQGPEATYEQVQNSLGQSDFSPEEIVGVLRIAERCIQMSDTKRPNMRDVLRMLDALGFR